MFWRQYVADSAAFLSNEFPVATGAIADTTFTQVDSRIGYNV